MSGRVLIVEDEPKLAALLADYLRAASFEVQCLADGREVVPAVRASPPDLVLLDLMLPGRDGLDVCRELRTFTQLPIVMVTARVEEIDRLLGLELGADDYICKPFSPREVVARVKAILRRAQRQGSTTAEAAGGAAGGHGRPSDAAVLVVDEERFVARYHGQALDLTPVEFRLLSTLADSGGRVLSRQQLLDRLYTDHRVVNDRTVDSHVRNLRRKLQAVTPDADPIQSIYGVGYKWVPE